uniref:Pentacotripeptide-repeat region of PRORP domain-containing protein n=1 Tax=Fagus sylvatica TaxID=28930 RepID=A0A2N9FVV7_FAGSY
MEREALEYVFLRMPTNSADLVSSTMASSETLEFECSGLDKGYSRIGYKNGISSKGKDGVPIVTCCGERQTKLEWGRHPELGMRRVRWLLPWVDQLDPGPTLYVYGEAQAFLLAVDCEVAKANFCPQKLRIFLGSPRYFSQIFVSSESPPVMPIRIISHYLSGQVLEWRLEKMLEENVRDHDSFSELMYLCGKVQNLPLAMRVFTSMEAHGVKPTSSLFNSLINACLSSGNVMTAHSLFEIMESSEGYKPNSDTYDAFISGFSKLGNADAMQAWYSAKKAAGFSADLQTYESLISGFGFASRRSFDQVKEFLKFVLDGGWEISGQMAERLVRFYVEVGTVEDMEELLVTLMNANQASKILSWVHCGIIRMYAISDRLDDVEYSVGRMLKRGFSFNCPDDVEKVICSYFRRAAYDRLDLFLEHIKGYYVLTRSTYDLLIAGYRRAGLSENLDLVMKHMQSAGLS